MARDRRGDAFFACYLLTPVHPPHRQRCTYVGFTVSPTRRIRQHNGELVNGAKRTARYRPWEMVVVVHGFPSKFHALQFEYAWQHPYICRFTRERLRTLQGTKGLGHPRSVKRKLVELHEMLHVVPWSAFPLTVTYTNLAIQNLARTSTFFKWPQHMTCEVRQLHEFKALAHSSTTGDTDDASGEKDGRDGEVPDHGVCYICDEQFQPGFQMLTCYYSGCSIRYHLLCLADHFLLEESMRVEDSDASTGVPLLRPQRGTCPGCTCELEWPLLVKNTTKSKSHKARTPRTPSKRRRRGRHPRSSETEQTNLTGAKDVRAEVSVSATGNVPPNRSPYGSPSMMSDSGWFEEDITWYGGDDGNDEDFVSPPQEHEGLEIIDLTEADD